MIRIMLIGLVALLTACGGEGEDTCIDGPVSLTVSGNIQPLYVTLNVNEDAFETKIIEPDTLGTSTYTQQVSSCDTVEALLLNVADHHECDVSVNQAQAGTEISVQCADVCAGDSTCLTWRNAHNEYRRMMNEDTIPGNTQNYPVPSPALNDLSWNTTLAEVAQAHADACVYEHNGERQQDFVALGGEDVYLGENIAFNAFSEPAQPVTEYQLDQMEAWWDEHLDWDYQAYNSATINGASHFTQMIWANTTEVGCGTAFCEAMLNDLDAYFSVCNYKQGGNYQNQLPYATN